MVIKVLGTGCAGCKALYETVKQAVEELGIEATVIKDEDVMKIMNYTVMSLQGLLIEDKWVSTGKKWAIVDDRALQRKY